MIKKGFLIMAEERRKAVRVEASIPIDVLGAGEETSGRTINLSMKGVYFRSSAFIEPLTKVRMGLIVPSSEEGDTKADFEGVVVRTEPESESEDVEEYKIAIYITFMSKRSEKVLSRYINKVK